MVKIKLNEEEFEITSFNKLTYFYEDGIKSNGNCNIKAYDEETIADLSQEVITTLKIYKDNELIYNLENINAHIEYVNETLVNDDMTTTLNLTFLNTWQFKKFKI